MRLRLLVCVAAGLAAVWPWSAASAHLHDKVQDVDVTVGWSDEPTFAGLPNAAQVILREGANAVDPARVALEIEVIFGGREGSPRRPKVALSSLRFGDPGEFRSDAFVPTRPGTYTFHVVGTLDAKPFDAFYTSGEKGAIAGSKFDDVREVAAASFPEKDPTTRDLAGSLARIEAGVSSADTKAGGARTVGIAGVAIGAVALVVGGAAAARRRSTG